jgi:hypothetical protein
VDGKDLNMGDEKHDPLDDRFLHEQRREPRPDFTRSLRSRLRAADPDGAARPAFRLHPAFSGALAVAALALAFTFPAVRATAQQALDLFRVREFAVVHVDENRMEQLKARNFDPEALFGGSVEQLQDPGPARRFADLAAAEHAAGFDVQSPSYLARTLSPDTVVVQGEGRVRVTLATQPLRDMMDLMEVRDLDLPAGLDGQRLEARIPAFVVQRFTGTGKRRAALVQSESPEISLPPGVDLARLGEIGLRVLGVEKAEAHRLAGVIDWHTTLLVPVVASATRFQQVSVNGARGMMLETTSTATPDGSDRGPGKVLMWTRDGRVYALLGNVDEVEMVQMAESVR